MHPKNASLFINVHISLSLSHTYIYVMRDLRICAIGQLRCAINRSFDYTGHAGKSAVQSTKRLNKIRYFNCRLLAHMTIET